jgi:NAD(P)-dependent dehydrogenase (short-subunit alcohol dehydrogenase family)
MTLNGKSALITGGSKGIGYGVAAALVDAGMDVAITARTESEVRDAEASLTERGGGRALGLVCDVRDLAQQRGSVAAAVERFGRLDALIANAGVGHFASIEELAPEDWQRVIDTNVTGVYYSIKAAVEALKASKGYFVTIGSLAGTNFFPGGAAYNASKAGSILLTKTLAAEWGPHDIQGNAIAPGALRTPMTEDLFADEDYRRMLQERVPMKRHGEPEELAGTAVYLASEASGYVSGHCLVVDGGWMALLN